MRHRLHDLIHQVRNKLRDVVEAIRTTASTLWKAHLATLEDSPVYETVLLTAVDLLLGHRVDLHQVLIRLMARLRHTPPELPESDGWAH